MQSWQQQGGRTLGIGEDARDIVVVVVTANQPQQGRWVAVGTHDTMLRSCPGVCVRARRTTFAATTEDDPGRPPPLCPAAMTTLSRGLWRPHGAISAKMLPACLRRPAPYNPVTAIMSAPVLLAAVCRGRLMGLSPTCCRTGKTEKMQEACRARGGVMHALFCPGRQPPYL